MLKSMTGFGRAEHSQNGRTITVEVRSVNGRYGEYSIRLPRSLAGLEPRLRRLVQQMIARGTVNLTLSWGGSEERGLPQLDMEAARHYLGLLQRLKKELGLTGKPDLKSLVRFSDIFISSEPKWDEAQAWQVVRQPVERALEALDRMRAREGQRLHREISRRLARIEQGLRRIEKMAPGRVKEAGRSLEARMDKALPQAKRDPDLFRRLAQEIALLADRLDITEECVRLRSHLKAFRQATGSGQPVGRRLDFLLQEMNREANTMASKANHSGISLAVVAIKEEIEKIREQVQNIE